MATSAWRLIAKDEYRRLRNKVWYIVDYAGQLNGGGSYTDFRPRDSATGAPDLRAEYITATGATFYFKYE